MTGLAALLEARQESLVDIFGPDFAVTAVDDDHGRIDVDGLVIHFCRREGDWLIDSSLELASIPAHAVPVTGHLHTWLVLKSRGEDWPPAHGADPLGDEVERVARALPVVRDEALLIEALLWGAGYMNGYGLWD